jgi:hypothetical protein
MDHDNVVILYEDEKDVLKRQIEELTEKIVEGTTRMCTAAESFDVEATRLAGADLALFREMRAKAMSRLMELLKLEVEAALKAE